MRARRELVEELHPANDEGRHLVRVYDILNQDGKYLSGNASIVCQKKDDDGNILDEWYVNIRPKEMKELVSRLEKAQEILSKRLRSYQKGKEEDDDDGDGGRPSTSRGCSKG